MTATAQQEVDSLDRVLTRLATTDEGNLEKVVTLAAHCCSGQIVRPARPLTSNCSRKESCVLVIGAEQASAHCNSSAQVTSPPK